MKWIHSLQDIKVRQRYRYFYVIVLFLLWIAMIGSNVKVKEDKEYTEFDYVALYILTYDDVPDNYVPKSQGAPEGEYYISVYDVYDNTRVPVKLPTGYDYTEAYINANVDDGPGEERFVFSDEALYYTNNHYNSFSEITVSKILGGYYFFMTLVYGFLLVGLIIVMIMVFVIKEITVNDFKKDILLDYKLLTGTIEDIKEKGNYYYKKWKYTRQLNRKEEK